MRVRLPGSFARAKSTVLFTAPPASAWQLCLPVLYLIPPAKLALMEISLPDPLGLQAEACVPLGCSGLVSRVLGELSGRAPGKTRLEPTLGAIPGSWGWCLPPSPSPTTSTPTLHSAALCWLLWPPN